MLNQAISRNHTHTNANAQSHSERHFFYFLSFFSQVSTQLLKRSNKQINNTDLLPEWGCRRTIFSNMGSNSSITENFRHELRAHWLPWINFPGLSLLMTVTVKFLFIFICLFILFQFFKLMTVTIKFLFPLFFFFFFFFATFWQTVLNDRWILNNIIMRAVLKIWDGGRRGEEGIPEIRMFQWSLDLGADSLCGRVFVFVVSVYVVECCLFVSVVSVW